VNFEGAAAVSVQSAAASVVEITAGPAVPPATQPASTASAVNLLSTDYFEGFVSSAATTQATAPSEGAEFDTLAEIEIAPATVTGYVQTLAAVRLREQPATTARTMRSIAPGSRLEMLSGGTPGWTQVRMPDGATGWIVG
jgi:hypothetical protein